MLGDRLRFMGAVPGTDLHVIQLSVPPGSGPPPHRHASVEIFHVTAGEVTFSLFDGGAPRDLRAGPGAVVTVAADAPHTYVNRGATTAEMLVVLQRQMIAMFEELGTSAPTPPGPPSAETIARVVAICGRHGVTFLPPP